MSHSKTRTQTLFLLLIQSIADGSQHTYHGDEGLAFQEALLEADRKKEQLYWDGLAFDLPSGNYRYVTNYMAFSPGTPESDRWAMLGPNVSYHDIPSPTEPTEETPVSEQPANLEYRVDALERFTGMK